jgi:valyl-tRNA synthetase
MSDEAELKQTGNELAKAYDPSAIEAKWARYWVDEKLFDTAVPVEGDSTKAFTMLLPPPNVTGRLHMGHMLNQTEMDILTRWHRMSGERALWVPGTDHAGIATQMMVEKQLAAEGKTTRKELGREAFTERVWEWKRQYGGAITDQMRRLGASVDWSREYFTMDDGLSNAVIEAFVRLYEQGLIYRGAYIVNWDPVLQSAVSDLEVTHEDRAGKLYYLRYPLADGTGSIVIATTRPETMLGDTAVAVNPSDERYQALIGRMIALPLTGREIPIVADDWANPEFGTGAVKVTPAHDPNDFAIGQRHSLPSLAILDPTAKVDLPGSKYHGLDRYVAREQIVADLDALGLLVDVKDHAMSVGLSQRSGSVIEPRLSDQWFIRIQPLADKAIAAVRDGHIKFTPEMYAKTYFEWMGNIHDWCISRQLWWGHRIPAWHCGACKAINVSRDAVAVCATCGSADVTQETDVLDTWFSSGLLPFTVFGWPTADGKPSADMAAFYPTDLLVTGFDILFFWVARMIMLGCHFMLDVPMPDGSQRELKDAVPFREVYIHALVRDANREKMSKTKGNVIDPIDIIERFGTDAVRFTLASMASPGTDIAFSEARTEGNRAFANKIWNAARFIFMQLDIARNNGIPIDNFQQLDVMKYVLLGGAEQAPLETRWIISRLSDATSSVNAALANYRFDEAASAVYQFFWGDLCDWYLEVAKRRLDSRYGTGEQAQSEAVITLLALSAVLEASLRLLSPFMPFITEEIWHAFFQGKTPMKSIALANFPKAADFALDRGAATEMHLMQSLIVEIRSIRKEIGVPEKEFVPVAVYCSDENKAMITANIPIVQKTARVTNVGFVELPITGMLGHSTPEFDVLVVYERTIDKAAECERLTKDLAKYEKGLQAAEKQLGNEGFISRAPAHIVEGLKKQAAETKLLYDKTKAAMDELGCPS